MTLKIDILREKLAIIGKKQVEYHQFFPPFADQLVKEFGNFLEDPSCVALCKATGDFSFDHEYRHAGLDFEDGRYRIPIMIRLRNLNDEGEVLFRIKLTFVLGQDSVRAWVGDADSVTFAKDNPKVLYEAIYGHLTELLSSTSWFDENGGRYQGTQIGFHSVGKVA